VEAAAATSDGTYAYVIGGSFFGNTLNAFRRYDPATNTWTSLAPMPVAASMASAVYYPPTQKIYVFGGERFENSVNYEVTRIYDIASNTWSAGAFMPDVRSFMASGYNSINGKIYLVSGYNTGFVDSAQPDTWEYDPVLNTFTSRAPIPHPVGGAASGIINGHMYVAGGRDANTNVVDLLWDYDIAADTWTQRANMPCGQDNVPGSAVALGKLFVFGGGNPFASDNSRSNIPSRPKKDAKGHPHAPMASNTGRAYDPATDTWLVAPNMNVTRLFPSGTAIGNTLFAAGGDDGNFLLLSAEMAEACAETAPPEVSDYVVTTFSGASIVPGTTDIGNHCDDCITTISLPFPVQFYDHVFTSANVFSDGNLQFTSSGGFLSGCIPDASISDVIAPYWTDLYTANAASGQGIFTSISGTAPNRIFNIEWRAAFCCGDGSPTENFEVRLYENQLRIDIIYGMTSGFGGVGIGVQRETGLCHYTAVSCNTVPAMGTRYTFAPSAPTAISAVSRKTHGGVVDFDIDLPLSGTPGIESRSGGVTKDYTIVVAFSSDLTITGNPQAEITAGTATIGNNGVSNGGIVNIEKNIVTIPLTLVSDQQTIRVMLNGVSNPSLGLTPGVNLEIPMSTLLGDTNANGAVNSADVSQTKARAGRPLSTTNFRSDVNLSGTINASDVSLVKSNAGHGLP
jgi:N-acetylneuraminic acid mutarotase